MLCNPSKSPCQRFVAGYAGPLASPQRHGAAPLHTQDQQLLARRQPRPLPSRLSHVLARGPWAAARLCDSTLNIPICADRPASLLDF